VTPEDDLPGPNQFRLVVSRKWPGPGPLKNITFNFFGKRQQQQGCQQQHPVVSWDAVDPTVVDVITAVKYMVALYSQLLKLSYRICKILKDDFLAKIKIPESDFGWTKSSWKSVSR
jgi:hypothetical protein